MQERVFVLPDLGEGLEEAEISAWLVAEGDEVTLNQPIAEIETAKATVEVPSPYAGRIARLHAPAGASVPVGAPLVTFELDAGDEPGAVRSRPTTTPAVRRLAKDRGIDLGSIAGTGVDGRITREDVERAAGGGDADAERVPLTTFRRAIADALEATARIPQVTTFRTVDCVHLEAFRGELGVSPLPVVVRALAETCGHHPMLNASWSVDAILIHRRVHVGVATDTARGLVVAVLRDAGSLGIAEISDRIARLAEATRAGTMGPEDASGATIAVSNTGSYGSEYGTPLLAPGTGVTLALGAIRPRPIVADGEVVARPACTLSVTFDHRVLDGATVGRAVTDLVAVLEDPDRLRALPR